MFSLRNKQIIFELSSVPSLSYLGTLTYCYSNIQEEADEAYHKKVEENAKAAEERTAKKRARR